MFRFYFYRFKKILKIGVNMFSSFNTEQQIIFDKYADFLLSENKKKNLTAIKDREEVQLKHFIDSILPLDFFRFSGGASLIDVGSGAGFPGVPLKIMRPDLSVTCIDSTGKKVQFLRDLSRVLEIPFEAICIRAEDAGQSDMYREKYDIAISRAVAALPVLCELCLPLVKPGGVFLALKGEKETVDSAKSAISILGGKLIKSVEYKLPSGDRRKLFVIEKIASTEEKYPRLFGAIDKKPL
jgi:16S rRNA (guanine(527)-N(7))-methyltransferase RsmG